MNPISKIENDGTAPLGQQVPSLFFIKSEKGTVPSKWVVWSGTEPLATVVSDENNKRN